MEDHLDHLQRLSNCLTQATRVVQELVTSNQNAAGTNNQGALTAVGQAARANTVTGTGMLAVGQAVNRARAMMTQSTSRGMFSRLNSRERLRATSSTNLQVPGKAKKAKLDPKVFEFVLVKVDDENEDSDSTLMLTDDSIVLRGFITLDQEASEMDVRKALSDAINMKYPVVAGQDLVFLKANRRRLSQPVNCHEYSFKQIKSLAGQGSIYVRVKQGYSFLLDEEEKENPKHWDSLQDNHQACHTQSTPTPVPIPEPVQAHVPSEHPQSDGDDDLSFVTVRNLNTATDVNLASLESAVEECVRICGDACNPVEILRCAQKTILQGRTLDVTSLDIAIGDGDTNFVSIDRFNVLNSAIEELKDIQNPRLTLEVSFYGENAYDAGGPRKEFFRLCLREIQQRFFDNGLRELMAAEYESIGTIMALSILQNGPIPRFIPEEVIQEIFSKDPPRPCIAELRKGFIKLGLYQLVTSLPIFLHLLRPNEANRLSRRQLTQLLRPSFSEEGSNARKYENETYAAFSKYVKEASAGRRGSVTLGSILEFITGVDEEPPLGFELNPSIQFGLPIEFNKWAFIPKANTCSVTLTLVRGSSGLPLPKEEELFQVYDTAFCNNYFGLS